MNRLAILGSTGSIGLSTLAVVREHPEQFKVYVLIANRNVELIARQCIEFSPQFAVLSDEKCAKHLRTFLQEHSCVTTVLSGVQAACELVAVAEVDQVMSAIVGVAGLLPTLAAIKAGKRILLANKESLITCGHLFMEEVKKNGALLLPIDSEHNAIYQCLPKTAQQQLGYVDLAQHGISSLVLTGSGGPFRDTPIEQLKQVTVEQACAHPNWSMGKKISVDSATMMNKGLEYIEAKALFNASDVQMEIVIHPQSIIHSMVRYVGGSVLAQLGVSDMRVPISHALNYPERSPVDREFLDFTALPPLTFLSPDYARYPCLQLAIEASNSGQAATTILNAANEVIVEAFLEKQITFTEIAELNNMALQKLSFTEPKSVAEVLEIDKKTRNEVVDLLQSRH